MCMSLTAQLVVCVYVCVIEIVCLYYNAIVILFCCSFKPVWQLCFWIVDKMLSVWVYVCV